MSEKKKKKPSEIPVPGTKPIVPGIPERSPLTEPSPATSPPEQPIEQPPQEIPKPGTEKDSI